MKNIRLIISDMDGTLLTSEKTLSPKTREVLARCQEKGIKIVPATARDLKVLSKFGLMENPKFDAIITTNGSRIYYEDEIIYQKGISTQQLNSFLPIILENFPGFKISVNINDTFYANFDLQEILPMEMDFIRTDLSDLPEGLIERMIMDIQSQENYDKLKPLLPDFIYSHTIEGTFVLRILSKEISKAKAIKHLSQHLDIPLSQVVFFGDDANDIEAFTELPNKVAVANAIEELKEIASDITLSNDDDGVALWIEGNVL